MAGRPQARRLPALALQIFAILAFLLISSIFAAAPAYAITPFNGFTCAAGPQTVGGLTTVPPSTATVTLGANDRLRITVTNGQSGTIHNNNTTTNVVALPGTATGTVDGPGVIQLETPNIGGGGGLFATAPGQMSITFSCTQIANVVTPGASVPGGSAAFLDLGIGSATINIYSDLGFDPGLVICGGAKPTAAEREAAETARLDAIAAANPDIIFDAGNSGRCDTLGLFDPPLDEGLTVPSSDGAQACDANQLRSD